MGSEPTPGGTSRSRLALGLGAAAAAVALGLVVALALNRGSDHTAATPPTTTSASSASPSAPSSPPATPSSTPSTTPAQPGEVTAEVTLWQGPKQTMPMLCTMMLKSHPPQCSGPVLVDPNFSWDQVPHTEVGGIIWNSERTWVVGRFDLSKGPTGSFILTRPLNSTPAPTPSPEPELDLSPLCTDPNRGADPSQVSNDDEHARYAVLRTLPVIAEWHGSDRAESFNVLVRGDAEQARRAIRAVWGGPLCVATSTAPTLTERDAAMQRIMRLPKTVGLSMSSLGGRDGIVQVGLLQPDPAAEAKVRAAAGKGIQVRFSYVYQPFTG